MLARRLERGVRISEADGSRVNALAAPPGCWGRALSGAAPAKAPAPRPVQLGGRLALALPDPATWRHCARRPPFTDVGGGQWLLLLLLLLLRRGGTGGGAAALQGDGAELRRRDVGLGARQRAAAAAVAAETLPRLAGAQVLREGLRQELFAVEAQRSGAAARAPGALHQHARARGMLVPPLLGAGEAVQDLWGEGGLC